jgi:Kef-type K+ transport system membrane component KefB
VAVLGVVAPIVLGFFVSRYFHPDGSTLVHLFVGAALCATSVGITARVLEDAGRIGSPEGRIILGAAVIDDLLALVVLALVTGMVAAADAGEVVASTDLIPVLIKVGLFFALATVSALFLSKRLFSVASHLRGRDLLLVTALVFCLGLAWAAEELGLAPIVGAFFAGLALDETTYQEFFDHGETRRLEDLVEPIEAFLVPVFFVLMGLRVDLGVLASPEILGFALALTGVAIFGKQICGLGVRERDTSRLAVGIGMIPRGEVGLVFAGVGASLSVAGRPIIDPAVYSALVLMVFVTTLLTPSLMVAALSRHHRTAPSRG